MVKLDVSLLRYLQPEDFKVLTSVEMGMRNHELVPGTLINSIATLRFGGCGKLLVNLTQHKLLAYERGKRYDGYRLTYAGYDYLALNALMHKGKVGGVGNQIGVGKESDVFICESPDQKSQYAIKFHRLGRVCFRKVSEKRDFYTNSKNKTSWIYLSRKAAQREFEFLSFMYYKQKLPVPEPISSNRHVVVMKLINGRILNHYTRDSFEPEHRNQQISDLYKKLMDLILKFANDARVIHGDFNEFNILIENETLSPVIIDLPQMIYVSHELAPEQFERDVNCIVEFFSKRFHYQSDYIPSWSDVKETADAPACLLSQWIEEIDLNNKESSCGKHDEDGHEDLDRDSDNNSEDLLAGDDHNSNTTLMLDPQEEMRQNIRREILRREANRKKRDAAKPKNIKGEANPVRRRRKTNRHLGSEDLGTFLDERF